jgi:hypothetical protein
VAWPIFSLLPWTCKHSEELDAVYINKSLHVTVQIRYRVQLAIKPSCYCRKSALGLQHVDSNQTVATPTWTAILPI